MINDDENAILQNVATENNDSNNHGKDTEKNHSRSDGCGDDGDGGGRGGGRNGNSNSNGNGNGNARKRRRKSAQSQWEKKEAAESQTENVYQLLLGMEQSRGLMMQVQQNNIRREQALFSSCHLAVVEENLEDLIREGYSDTSNAIPSISMSMQSQSQSIANAVAVQQQQQQQQQRKQQTFGQNATMDRVISKDDALSWQENERHARNSTPKVFPNLPGNGIRSYSRCPLTSAHPTGQSLSTPSHGHAQRVQQFAMPSPIRQDIPQSLPGEPPPRPMLARDPRQGYRQAQEAYRTFLHPVQQHQNVSFQKQSMFSRNHPSGEQLRNPINWNTQVASHGTLGHKPQININQKIPRPALQPLAPSQVPLLNHRDQLPHHQHHSKLLMTPIGPVPQQHLNQNLKTAFPSLPLSSSPSFQTPLHQHPANALSTQVLQDRLALSNQLPFNQRVSVQTDRVCQPQMAQPQHATKNTNFKAKEMLDNAERLPHYEEYQQLTKSQPSSSPSKPALVKKSYSSASPKPSLTKDSTPSTDTSEEKVYCLCKQPYDPTRFYIACDSCDDWFHGDCVNVTPEMSVKIKTYICPLCAVDQTEVVETSIDSSSRGYGESKSSPPSSTSNNASTRVGLTSSQNEGTEHAAQMVTAEYLVPEVETRQSSPKRKTAHSHVMLDNLDQYQSLIERKLVESGKTTLSQDSSIHRRHCQLDNFTQAHITNALGKSSDMHTIRKYKHGTYINCDLRYFNLNSAGKFDVVLMDPPWRVGGNQRQLEHSNMFSNNKFKLQYNTLSYDEIMDIDVESLSDGGFLFLWVLNSSLQIGLACMNKWGYSYVDRLVWVKKSKKNDSAIQVTHGYYFLHSTETCLVGVKYPKNQKGSNKLQYLSKISNDVLFHKVGTQSQKPKTIYEVIESMMPGARKVELFARNHNIRDGWLSLGNRLGPSFDREWKKLTSCYTCDKKIKTGSGKKRYKHKRRLFSDVCEECFHKLDNSQQDYFVMENSVNEAIYHDWYSCDHCNQYPICGVRFTCSDPQCEGYDLCESCFDSVILTEHSSPLEDVGESKQLDDNSNGPKHDNHKCTKQKFEAVEVPDPGMGFPAHLGIRCNGCLTSPIVGERFTCRVCTDMNFCRKCFFKQKEPRQHKSTHDMDLVPEPVSEVCPFKCVNCKTKRPGQSYFMCRTCFMLVLCSQCHQRHDMILPIDNFLTHKHYHTFVKV